MSSEEYKKVFVKNLKHYMEINGKTQADLINDLGLLSGTVSSWCTGRKLPRMGKIQMLADYFGIEKSDLLEDKNEQKEYYLDKDTRDFVDFLHKNPNYKILFDASRKTKPEDIQLVVDLMDKIRGENDD